MSDTKAELSAWPAEQRESNRLMDMLKVRGKKCVKNDFGIEFWHKGRRLWVHDNVEGTLNLLGITPEQVIAATCGDWACEVSYEQDGVPRCSNCQNVLYDEYKDGIKNYCDECGARVVER